VEIQHVPATTAYTILPAVEAPPEQVVKSLMSLGRTNLPTIYLHRPDEDATRGPDTIPVACDCQTLGQLMKRAVEEVDGDLFLWVPPGVEVDPAGIDTIVATHEANRDASLIVSDYRSNGSVVKLHPLREDLTEREDFGALWAIPRWALDKIGGPDKSLRFTTFYDLRLKLAEVGTLNHLRMPTHSIEVAEEEPARKAEALFFPGKGAYGGFSYLFMDPEEEKETEQVFYECLKRRGAWLELPDNDVAPAEVKGDDPLVTVVIPVHNRAKFLPKAIESVLRGTMQNFEIIVVDNASRDESLEVAREYEKKDSRIRALSNGVNVISVALNMGVKASKGRYIAQLDSDDEYTENTLADMTGHLESHPKCGLAISYYELMDESGKTLEEFGIIEHLEYNLNNILRVDGAGAVRVWHKSVIEEFGGFHEQDFPNYGEDYDLVLKVSERYHVDRVHKVCYRYRRHPGNTDALRKPADKIRAKTLARTRALERRKKQNGIS
jgi:GT2 family glycosyltransferase